MRPGDNGIAPQWTRNNHPLLPSLRMAGVLPIQGETVPSTSGIRILAGSWDVLRLLRSAGRETRYLLPATQKWLSTNITARFDCGIWTPAKCTFGLCRARTTLWDGVP